MWEQVSGDSVLYITGIHSQRQLSYIVKYVSHHRASWGYSKNWFPEGFLAVWEHVKTLHPKDLDTAILHYDYILQHYDKAPSAATVVRTGFEGDLNKYASNHNLRLFDYETQ